MAHIDELLKFDPLAAAEKITGVDYKDDAAGIGFDNPSVALGLMLAHAHGQAKERALTETGDTVFSNELSRYRMIVEGFGFEEVLRDEWDSSWGHRESFYIFAHRKGLLLSFDTWSSDGRPQHINCAKVQYNWRPAVDSLFDCISSGHMHPSGVWVGDHDAREALIHNLNTLNNRGEFVAPWVERPFMWLLHFDDPKVEGYDYAAISEARIKRLPQWVQDFIGPESVA